MSGLLGEFEVSMDPKGRVRVPAALTKQLSADDNARFVITRGFEKCLVLYPYTEWQHVGRRLNGLNMFVKKNRDFVRYFMSGATELTLDANGKVRGRARAIGAKGRVELARDTLYTVREKAP